VSTVAVAVAVGQQGPFIRVDYHHGRCARCLCAARLFDQWHCASLDHRH
jgi:hypothetical protein